ncbi:hypothetical protein [Rummeliibacillus suwonensis]|uniref:hypothetical protein n=1 Tax=Rummeliibacillus suwonensis TaxID=1306154 RepID=UPI001AAE4543|nr:hypothetical protein [Rummeliibacillus suwonensis]MBO2535679.1 hypothetical protein [Rummeliibacillus suwonensis]
MKFNMKKKVVSTLVVGALGLSLLGGAGSVEAKHYNKVPDSYNPVIKECRFVLSKNTSYPDKLAYATGEVDTCSNVYGYYNKKFKQYIDLYYMNDDYKDGDIYDDWNTSDFGYYQRVYYFYAEQHTPGLKTSDVQITNYKTGKKDRIVIKNIKKNDIVNVYKKRNKVTYVADSKSLLISGKSKGSSLTLYVNDLGKQAGQVYVAVKRGNLKEGFTRKITFGKENVATSKTLTESKIKIANNKGKSDTIKVSGLSKGQQIIVYKGTGSKLAAKTASGSSITISIKQLGKKSGYVYLARTEKGKMVSQKVKITYKAEK